MKQIFTIHDRFIRSILNEGVQLGIAKGERIVITKGEQVGIEKTAINMISSGMDDDLIEEITELSVDKIKRLRKK